MIKKLCVLLSLIMALSLLGACNSSKPQDNPSSDVSSTQRDDEIVSEPSKGNEEDSAESSEDELLDDFFEEENFEEDEYKYVSQLYVYNSEKPITQRYGGMSGTVWHAYGFMKDDVTGRAYTDKMMEVELNRLQHAGMHYCRTRYQSEWVWDYKDNAYNWNSKRFGYFCDYANALQKRDINILLQVGWHFGFVSNITTHSIDEVSYLRGDGEDKFGESTGFSYEGLSSEDARMTRAARRFGYFYAETLRQLRARGINNVSHLVYMTEPSNAYQGAPAGAENEAYLLFSRAFKQKLIEENVANTVKHMGPNETSKTGDELFKYVVDNAPDLFDVYTVHNYPNMNNVADDVLHEIYGETLDSFVKHAKNGGIYGKKEFWLDEFDVKYGAKQGGQSNYWEGLQNVLGNIMAQQRGIETTVFWQLIDQLWTDQSNTGDEFSEGIHICGDIPSLFVSATPYEQYYATGLFSRYNGYKNGTVYRTSYMQDAENAEGVYMGAVKLEDGSWTITIVNHLMDDTYIAINFDKAINQTLYRHTCTPSTVNPNPDARLADVDKYFVDVKDKIYDTIPGGSVVIYTGLEY